MTREEARKAAEVMMAFVDGKNRVHFHVARDKNGTLYLYLGKPTRKENEFSVCNIHSCVVCGSCYFEYFGLNADDFKDLKWEDEPIEVFLNMED